jgi:hypothetical protein
MEQNNSLGIIGQNIRNDGQITLGYSHNIFEIDGKIYTVEETNQDTINRLITIFKNDEFKGSGSGIYTYVIGTQYNINVDDKTITRYEVSENCDIDKMNIWLKKAVTIQEIETKHGTIINNLLNNYNKILDSFQDESSNLDYTTLYHDNTIDQLYYSGEIKYNQDTNSVDLNFLSGTYMSGIIDCSNPPEQTINCIKQFFSSKLSIDNVNIDTSCETYITKKMTIDQLNQYVSYGIPVYVFNDAKIANRFKNKDILIAKIKSQLLPLERMFKRFPSNVDTQEKINNLKKELIELEYLRGEKYYTSSHGGKHTIRKKYNYKRKNKKTQKQKHKIKKRKT